ncbi:MAG: hypothetical protein JWR07_1955 [Nevskia sp.]|nr:hypothetical protein [Nevskia sp.]
MTEPHAMASDRELLEKAAKAAGYNYTEFAAPDELSPDGWGFVRFLKGQHVVFWNPLTDDGDALRLAVKLHMRVEISEQDQATTAFVPGAVQGYGCDFSAGGKEAATRRAITWAAAAALGEQQSKEAT